MRSLLSLLAFAGSTMGCGYPDIPDDVAQQKHFQSSKDDTDAEGDGTDDEEDDGTDDAEATSTTDPFAGEDAWASALPDTNAKSAHASGGAGVVPSNQQQCLSCHTGSPGPTFTLGGTIPSGASMQIGLVDRDGNKVFTTADAEGNFWSEGKTKLSFPAYVAIRDDGGTKAMATPIQNAAQLDCNSCHGPDRPLSK